MKCDKMKIEKDDNEN